MLVRKVDYPMRRLSDLVSQSRLCIWGSQSRNNHNQVQALIPRYKHRLRYSQYYVIICHFFSIYSKKNWCIETRSVYTFVENGTSQGAAPSYRQSFLHVACSFQLCPGQLPAYHERESLRIEVTTLLRKCERKQTRLARYRYLWQPTESYWGLGHESLSQLEPFNRTGFKLFKDRTARILGTKLEG